MHAKDNRLSNNGGAIVFTIKVVANMLFVVEDKTPDTLRPCSGYTKVGRYAFEGDEERVGQEHGAPDLQALAGASTDKGSYTQTV